MSHRFEIFNDALNYIQELRSASLDRQRAFVEKMDEKGQMLIKYRKMTGSDA